MSNNLHKFETFGYYEDTQWVARGVSLAVCKQLCNNENKTHYSWQPTREGAEKYDDYWRGSLPENDGQENNCGCSNGPRVEYDANPNKIIQTFRISENK